MALVIEDGTGKEDAESYNSVADLKAYWDKHGMSYAGKSDPQIEQAARRGTSFLDGKYGARLPGTRAYGRLQALELPRSDWTDREGNEIADSDIPREWLAAHAEATHRELTTPNSLTPDVTTGKQVKRTALGPLEKEYFAAGTADQLRPTVTRIDELLAGILQVNQGSVSFPLRM